MAATAQPPTVGGRPLNEVLDAMSDETQAAQRSLVDALGSAASYNDKGYIWCNHDEAQVKEMQRGFKDEQIALARILGEERLGLELLHAIETGAAAKDGSGTYASLAEMTLGLRRRAYGDGV
jgi:hypothetical protein